MRKRVMLVCCILVVAGWLSTPVASRGAAVIDMEETFLGLILLDDDGWVWESGWGCESSRTSYQYPGAVAVAWNPDGPSGLIGIVAFTNGDLQPIDRYGVPTGALISGPPGALGVEDVQITDDDIIDPYYYGNVVIRSGCVSWLYLDVPGAWYGPCEMLGAGASAAEQGSWSEIKAEFRD